MSDANRNYLGWLKDPLVARYLECRYERHSIKKLKDYVRKIKRDPGYAFFAIVLKGENRHIGNIKIGPINRIHNSADVGVLIGDTSCWGKGLATEAIELAADYAFKKLNLHKLTAGAYECNIGSIKAFKKAGFAVEAVRKSHYFYGGRYIKGLLMGRVKR